MKSYGIWLDLARLTYEQDCGLPFPCALAPRWIKIQFVCLRLNAGFIRFLLSVNLKGPLAPYVSFKSISRSDLRAYYTLLSVPKWLIEGNKANSLKNVYSQ